LPPPAAGSGVGKGQQDQRGFSQAVIHIQLSRKKMAFAEMGKIKSQKIDQPIQEPIDAQYAVSIHLSHFFPAQ